MTEFTDELERIMSGLGRVVETMQKINEAVDHLEDLAKHDGSIELSALGVALFHTKTAYEDLDKRVKRIYHFSDVLSKHLLPERMRAADTDGFRVPGIARSFSILEKTSASFLDKDKGIEWLRSIGQGDIVQETVNSGTLASFCRNMLLEEGQEPPADIIKVSSYSLIGMTKYRPKAGEL